MKVKTLRTLFLSLCCFVAPGMAATLDVWIGTSTRKSDLSRGIHHALFDTRTGALTRPTLAAEVKDPGFLAMHPKGTVLYSTGTIDDVPSVVAYAITREDGQTRLSLMITQPTGDGGAAHLATDRTGQVLLSAQYGGGSTAIYPLTEKGAIGPRSKLIEHEGGSGVVARRQDKPHPHWVGTSPDNRFAFVPDLGMDKVMIYRLDTESVDLIPHGHGRTPPGGGPRHMAFHPGGGFIYVLNELALSVTAFAYDSDLGTMTAYQTIATVPAEEKAKERFVSASEIRVHPTGRFVYAANRGHDTITAFDIDPQSGRLTVIEREPVQGSRPRNFHIDPSGQWLLAAGRDSNNIAVFEIDDDTGELIYTRVTVMVPRPVCVLFGTN